MGGEVYGGGKSRFYLFDYSKSGEKKINSKRASAKTVLCTVLNRESFNLKMFR